MDLTYEETQREVRGHCRMMIDFMVSGYLIPFFGAGVNLANRPPNTGFQRGQYLPDAGELSTDIAARFRYPWSNPKDLLRVAWHASTQVGQGILYQHLHNIFSGNYPSTDVHEFFARLPGKLEAKGYPDRHQLIITTNYDDVLERAFDEVGAPYDVFSYVAHSEAGDDREIGKFKYIQYQREPSIIFDANNFDFAIESTVILKIHGAIDRQSWKRSSFVVTEDDYIDYLGRMNESFNIPAVLMHEMLDKRFLFLGYSLADWNLRVLLSSINARRSFKDRSWAIMNETKDWDPVYWSNHNVLLMKYSLKDYIRILNEELDSFPNA